MNRFSQWLTLATPASSLWSAPLTVQAQAPTSPGPHDAILMYQGADREAWLLERARKEGSITLYTSMAPTEAGPLLKEFERKYGIKTELWLSFCLDTTPRLAGINTTCRPTRVVANA